MNHLAETTVSAWKTILVPQFYSLGETTRADVCVIGGGIAGLTTAYLLQQEGLQVVVLEDGEIGSGETGHTTAHLTYVLDDRYFELERLHGTAGIIAAAASHQAAIDQVERIVAKEQIACDFERLDGFLFVPPEQVTDILQRELSAVHRAGLLTVMPIERAPLGSFDTGPALRFPQQAQFHPLKYLSGLAQSFTQRGGRIFTGTHAAQVKGGKNAHVITTAGHTVFCAAIVVATNTPINDLVTIHTKQAAYRTYVVGVTVPHGSVYRGLYWDTADPYHYVRLMTDDFAATDILVVGGEDHKTGQADSRDMHYDRLLTWTRERFDEVGDVQYCWSGQVMQPVDGLAFIGRNPADDENVFIATGDSGNGMTHGTIAGILLTDLIVGRSNPWTKLYDPARINLHSAPE